VESVANEIQLQVREKAPLSIWRLLKNRWVLHTLSLIAFFSIWDYVAANRFLGSALATPHEVAVQLADMMVNPIAGNTLMGHIWASTQRILIGFAIGAALATPLGLLMALNPCVNAIVKPVFDLIKPMPPIAWISIAIMWFGIEEASKVFIIVIGTFVPCLLNSYNGVRLIDPQLYDVIRMVGGSRKDEILHVCFPAAFPAIFAGLQISLSSAWTCVIAAELVSARAGLGFITILGMTLSRPALIVGGMVVIAVVAWVTTLTLMGLEKVMCPWKREFKSA
jgi:ABC-type nitrate/sulfonate/bicarbonate transport system permease component